MVAGLFNEKVGMMEKPLFVMPMLPENETICEVLSGDWIIRSPLCHLFREYDASYSGYTVPLLSVY